MLIKKVRMSGFERLYEGYKYSLKENRTGFGDGLFDFLKHCMISVEVEDLTSIEVYYMNKFATSLTIIGNTYKNFVNPQKNPDVHQKVSALLAVHNSILKDDDIISKDGLDNILPVGCLQYHVIATFKGGNITNILGALLNNFFVTENTFDSVYMGDAYYEEKAAGLFFQSFYKFMNTKLGQLDVISDFMINKAFYGYIDNRVNLAYVQTPFGALDFFGSDGMKLSSQQQRIMESMQTSPYVLESDIYMNFTIESTFDTFLKFAVNTNFVVDHSHFRLVMGYDHITIDDTFTSVKYQARISSGIDYLISYRKELMEKTEVDISKYNFIFNGNPIRYDILIPIPMIETWSENKDFNTTNEMHDIFTTMKQLSTMITGFLSL